MRSWAASASDASVCLGFMIRRRTPENAAKPAQPKAMPVGPPLGKQSH